MYLPFLLLLLDTASAYQHASSRLSGSGVRRFELTLTWGAAAPDGYERDVILVNGDFPAPLLKLKEGEKAEIRVVNELPFDTAIHFHGISQFRTPWSDGVPGITQRPIPAGGSFTHRWTAEQPGSFWYHAHSRGQMQDGLFGPIIVTPSNSTKRPFALIPGIDSRAVAKAIEAERNVEPLLLSDWWHMNSPDNWNLAVDSGVEIACVDSLLINGKGTVDCWSRQKLEKWSRPEAKPLLGERNITEKGCLPAEALAARATNAANIPAIPDAVFNKCVPRRGKSEVIKVSSDPQDLSIIAFDVISTASTQTMMFSIDSHTLWVYAADGHYIEPVAVEALPVANGDRYSVLVELDQPVANYTIRATSISINQLIEIHAMLAYDTTIRGRRAATATAKRWINPDGKPTASDVRIFSIDGTKNYPLEPPARHSNQTHHLHLLMEGPSYLWGLNDSALAVNALEDARTPLLYVDPPSPAHDAAEPALLTSLNNTWVDLIFHVHTLVHPPHPIHKHGCPAYVLGRGTGDFPYDTVADALAADPGLLNLDTPLLRDGWIIPAPDERNGSIGAWLVVRYWSKDPGAWLLHCHIQSHLSGGMAAVIADGIDAWPKAPKEYHLD